MKPIVNEQGFAPPTAKVTFVTGREVYLCNDYQELDRAMQVGAPFDAHAVVGMRPSPVVISPAHVVIMEVAS